MENNRSSNAVTRLLETKQGKTYTVLLGTITVVLLMFLLAIRPAWSSIAEKIAENNLKREYLEEADNKIADLQRLDAEYNQKILGVNYLNAFMDTEPRESFVIENIIGMVEESQVNLSAIQSDRPEALDRSIVISNGAKISEVRLRVSVSTDDINNLTNLVDKIEDSKIGLNIINSSYTTQEEGRVLSDPWLMSLELRYYIWDINDLKVR